CFRRTLYNAAVRATPVALIAVALVAPVSPPPSLSPVAVRVRASCVSKSHRRRRDSTHVGVDMMPGDRPRVTRNLWVQDGLPSTVTPLPHFHSIRPSAEFRLPARRRLVRLSPEV